MASTHGSWDSGFGPRAADSAECLLVVGGYSENQRDLGTVVAAAQDRILMSPSLGDFFELRLVDMGPRPKPGTDDAADVARLVFELTTRPGGVARNFSALLVIDESALAIARVLRLCQANKVLTELNVRFRGIARNDDRKAAAGGRRAGTGPRTVISARGERQSSDALDQEVERYAAELLADFGSGGAQGLSAQRLDELGTEAVSNLRSFLEADMAGSLERRRAELREEAARQDAEFRQEAERRREQQRQEAERREAERDAERRKAAAIDEGGEPVVPGADKPQPPAADEQPPQSRRPGLALGSRVAKALGLPRESTEPQFDASATLLACEQLIQARDQEGLRAALLKLRGYAGTGVGDKERERLRDTVQQHRLLWPGLSFDGMDVEFYEVMLRLAYKLPLSYAAYCDVEDRLPQVSGVVQPPHRPLLEAMSGLAADIRVAAITHYFLGQERLTAWFRADRVSAKQLLATLDGRWDRPYHADVLYDVFRMRLAEGSQADDHHALRSELRQRGYLAAALAERYPESESKQIAILMALLHAAYPDGLNRRNVEEVAAASAPTRALPRAVLASLRDRAEREWAADTLAHGRGEKGAAPGGS